jgi:hypothetical protein
MKMRTKMINKYKNLINNGHILGGIIKDFPYPEKICPFCMKKLKVVQAIHLTTDKYQYKVLYLDPNPGCPVYDENVRKAYARIYYSSDDAYAAFHDVSMPVYRWEQDDLVSYYK